MISGMHLRSRAAPALIILTNTHTTKMLAQKHIHKITLTIYMH